MRSTIKSPGQSYLDVCLQHTGSIESLFDLLLINNLEMVEPVMQPLTLLLPNVIRPEIVDYINKNGILISSESEVI